MRHLRQERSYLSPLFRWRRRLASSKCATISIGFWVASVGRYDPSELLVAHLLIHFED
ncbi:hypothetical protein CPB85DRAFT_1320100 [Mucidula mucida]|nr:hypothetical protein CPB85DRAFT_1320100 [Mucidula mucida]